MSTPLAPCARKRVTIVSITVVVVGLIAASTFFLLRREKKEWVISTQVASTPAQVTIVWSWRSGHFKFGHQYLIPGGGDRYDVTVASEGGDKLIFTTEWEPRAIWFARGFYYVACSSLGDDWFLAKLDSNQTLTRIPRSALPEGNIAWNLVDSAKQSEWQKKFDLFAQ